MKKRYVLKNKRRFMITMAVAISIIFSSLILVTHRPVGYTEISFNKIVVTSGDTLWDIASDFYGSNSDIRKKVTMIKKANDLRTSELSVGQVLLIPRD